MGNRPANSSRTRWSTCSNNLPSDCSMGKSTNIRTIEKAKARAVVLNFRARPWKISAIDDWLAPLAMSAAPPNIIVMPITVPRKPVMGIAQTMTRNRP